MELRHLRYFVAVAHERHFTRAAEALGVSQPPLSQQIRNLEQEVGTQLFRRLTRGVELTAAGEMLFRDAQDILARADQALEKARGAARGISGKLSLGFASSVAFNAQVFRVVNQFIMDHPGVELINSEAKMSSLMHDLQEGILDGAFIRLPCESSRAFSLRMVSTEEMVLALPQQHKLSGRPSLKLGELAGDKLIVFPEDVSPSLYALVKGAAENAGLDRGRFQQAPQISSSLSMVSAGIGVAVVPRSMTCIRPQNVCFAEIAGDMLRTDVAFAWRRDNTSPIIRRVVRCIASTA